MIGEKLPKRVGDWLKSLKREKLIFAVPVPHVAPRRAVRAAVIAFGDFFIALRLHGVVVSVHEVPVPLVHGVALVPAQVALEGVFVRVRRLVDGEQHVVEEYAPAHRAVVALYLDGGFFRPLRLERHPQTGLAQLPALQAPVHVLRHGDGLGGFSVVAVVVEARVQAVGEVVGVVRLEEVVLLAELVG